MNRHLHVHAPSGSLCLFEGPYARYTIKQSESIELYFWLPYYSLGQPSLDFRDRGDAPRVGKWVPSVDQQPPPRNVVAKVPRRIVIELRERISRVGVKHGETLTEPTSDANTALAPIANIADT